jgi:hypothetical protein
MLATMLAPLRPATAPLEGLLWLADERAYWSNICTAQYYGLSGITAR